MYDEMINPLEEEPATFDMDVPHAATLPGQVGEDALDFNGAFSSALNTGLNLLGNIAATGLSKVATSFLGIAGEQHLFSTTVYSACNDDDGIHTDVEKLSVPQKLFVPPNTVLSEFGPGEKTGAGKRVCFKSLMNNKVLVNHGFDIFLKPNATVGTIDGKDVHTHRVGKANANENITMLLGSPTLTVISTNMLVHSPNPIVTYQDAVNATPITHAGTFESCASQKMKIYAVFTENGVPPSAQIPVIRTDSNSH
jgi:hypothetical protein